MTDRDEIVDLPRRLAMTLVDTSSFFGAGMFGADPVPADTSGSTADPTAVAPSTTDPLGSALARVNEASALAQTTGAGAQAQNVESPGSTTVARQRRNRRGSWLSACLGPLDTPAIARDDFSASTGNPRHDHALEPIGPISRSSRRPAP